VHCDEPQQPKNIQLRLVPHWLGPKALPLSLRVVVGERERSHSGEQVRHNGDSVRVRVSDNVLLVSHEHAEVNTVTQRRSEVLVRLHTVRDARELDRQKNGRRFGGTRELVDIEISPQTTEQWKLDACWE
jgi:hypothetical protein